jgi:hypothetical protein
MDVSFFPPSVTWTLDPVTAILSAHDTNTHSSLFTHRAGTAAGHEGARKKHVGSERPQAPAIMTHLPRRTASCAVCANSTAQSRQLPWIQC